MLFTNPTENPNQSSNPLSDPIQSSPSPTAPSTHLRVNIYLEFLPFIQKFRGKTPAKSESLPTVVIADLVLLLSVGLRIIIFHGSSPKINMWFGRLGILPNFLNELRVTKASTVYIISMVLVRKVNKKLVSLINKAGGTAIGLSGVDGRLLTAWPSASTAQLGFVGDVAPVNSLVLCPLVENTYIPVIASVTAMETGQLYNINADIVARELAAALGAEKLILLTDVVGILEDKMNWGVQ